MQAYSANKKIFINFPANFKIPVIHKTGILILFACLLSVFKSADISAENNQALKSLYSSDTDTIILQESQATADLTEAPPPEEDPDEWIPDPAKSAMLSAALPGLGQIYNRKYWKAPIIYAGFGAVIYFLDMNSSNYRDFRRAYYYRIDGNPHTVDEYPEYSTDVLKRAMNYYRRNLEITYIAAAALYILNILDASVDAHLMDFDISEDLSLRMEPLIERVNHIPQPTAGLKLTINF